MDVLVLNCGSSSIKAGVVDPEAGEEAAAFTVTRLGDGDEQSLLEVSGATEAVTLEADTHAGALQHGLEALMEALPDEVRIAGVGHRVVHGGEAFSQPVRIDDDVEAKIEELIPVAPLHNPANLAGIRAARELLPDVPHVAVFDTAFHGTLPDRARRYAIPQDVAEAHNIKRFGFHGPSHDYVAGKAADYLGRDRRDLRIITCHLGNGASVAAVEFGTSVETSMGMTPLEGLVMGTRSGDIDPGAILHLIRQEGWDVDGVDDLLNRDSGLEGLSGVSNDLREIQERAAEGDEDCRRAIQAFSHRARKYIGGYAAVMGGVDAIVFTAGIGQNSALMRHRIGQRLDFLGAVIDEDANRDAEVTDEHPVADISTRNSRCKLLVVATDEQRAIAQKTADLVSRADQPADAERSIPIAVSGRHCHLTQESVEKLFGEGHTLTPRNDLSQPGQFAAEETVDVVGPNGELKKVRVLGPTRDHNQVEVARTDEFKLGIDAPVRMSGHIEDTPGVRLVGPAGEVELDDGLICAWRHIHMTPEDAEQLGVDHRDVVEVAVDTDERDLIFGDVIVRVSPDYKLEMHIDTDEANAANLSGGVNGALVETGEIARLNRRRTRFD